MPVNAFRLKESARASLTNGRRLLDDVEWLDYEEHRTTAYFLTQIAQEEFAKAFLLALVVRGVIPWDRRLLRAARDHTCKQLLGVVMDYLNPDYDEFKERCDAVILRHELLPMPRKIADAMNIFCHEKIGRWTEHTWVWDEDPEYDREALAVAEGRQDRIKQDALYARLATDGGVASTPVVVASEALRAERERASRMCSLAEGTLDGAPHPGLDFDDVAETLRSVFGSVASRSG
jgi:AbiV family abortive infection protein